MNKQDLQIFLGHSIVESKMSKAAKLQMLEFIQHEADMHQLMCLIMDGKIVKLDEQARQIVEDRFNVNEVFTSVQKDIIFGQFHRLFGACAKKCGRLATSLEKRLCKQKCIAARDTAILKAKLAKKKG